MKSTREYPALSPRQTPSRPPTGNGDERLEYARHIMRHAGQALVDLSDHLGESFLAAAECLHDCRGAVIVTGIGKAGLVGRKISATLSSTGTRSHFLHPAEAVHGDLGSVHADDRALVLSQSGETEEVVRLLPTLAELRVAVVAMTGLNTSTLGRAANITIELGKVEEACSLGLAPTTSTTLMLAAGDALALVVSRMRRFTCDDFARFHPGGNLGRQLSRVDNLMRPLQACRVGRVDDSVREVLVRNGQPGRRSGAVMIVDQQGTLVGIFTDSDLARLFERRRETALDGPIGEVMTAGPLCAPLGTSLAEAAQTMTDHKLSELPVVDAIRRPVGLLDVTDLGNHWARVFARPATTRGVPPPLAGGVFASAFGAATAS